MASAAPLEGTGPARIAGSTRGSVLRQSALEFTKDSSAIYFPPSRYLIRMERFTRRP